jgi:hypothetical protein
VGALPGKNTESGVAVLPDEKSEYIAWQWTWKDLARLTAC